MSKHFFGLLLIVLFVSCSEKVEKVPEESRFIKEVLDFNLYEPMELDVFPDRGIIFVERRGAVKVYDFKTRSTTKIDEMEVFDENEDGLLGIALDPSFTENNWVYLFYSDPGPEPIQKVSRFDLVEDSLIRSSEKVLLTIPTIRECCHSGGSLEFGPEGNLWITTGDNTNPFESSGYAPIDEREGRALWDSQKSAANTNDLRGKILRIKPEDDGTYSIPEGNLFPEGTELTRPEIYVMGCRNPFRHSIDSKTGNVYWGDIGPDAGEDDSLRGPRGLGEFNVAKEAGFYGWPYTRGNNISYGDYDFESETAGPRFDPNAIVNNSPNNTGLQKLPPVQASMIWYGYDRSEEFPWVGDGGVNPMAGPIFRSDELEHSLTRFPSYFEGKLIVYEWVRDWIYVITLDRNNNYVKADPFMSGTEFANPMDMIFGEDGALYILEYGESWYTQNLDARLTRITYNEGNRKPVAKIEASKEIGAVPLVVDFKGSQSIDYDKDSLRYEWFVNQKLESNELNPTFTFEDAGPYDVTLKITDPYGASDQASQRIIAGNTPPELKVSLSPSIDTFTDNSEIEYQINVTDSEDGSTSDGTIDASRIRVTLDFIEEGQDITMAAIGHQQSMLPEGKVIIDGSDCSACHNETKKVNGPSYLDIAMRYSFEDKSKLISSIIKGSNGVWGESMMSAHPQLSVEDVAKAVNYILSFDTAEVEQKEFLPISGKISFDQHFDAEEEGIYVLMVSYKDEGNPDVPESSLSVSERIVFRYGDEEEED